MFLTNWIIIIPSGLCLVFFLVLFVYFISKNKKNKELGKSISDLKGYLVEDFFRLRKSIQLNYEKNDLILNGVYIIYNQTKDKYYVGQSKDVIDRINMHFTGKGNGDVYADYKYGDIFIIRYVLLNSTKYKDLNKLEKDLITAYRANITGYNKTKGNK